jgi:F-type H+-transporting ATPase subunit gamma
MAITETSLKAKKFFLTPQDSSAVVGAPPYTFEPSPEIVFEKIVPYLLEVEIYKALLEARASEHSARMVAMKNAADKAGELIEDLKLAYNQARQSLITKEIAEISAGTLAIAGKKQNR